MAGSYPDVPGHRMAWDRDGSLLVHLNYSTGTVVNDYGTSSATHQDLNDEGTANTGYGTSGADRGLAIIFPEPRDVVGACILGNTNSTSFIPVIKTSTDTTNGLDGTWTSHGDALGWTVSGNNSSKTSMRDLIKTFTANGVTGIRYNTKTTGASGSNPQISTFHVYGSPSSGEAPNRLRLWHPTLDQEVDGAYFDWGDAQKGTLDTRTFRVKNPSATLTANSVTLTMEALTDTTPSVVSQHAFSDDGSTFTSSLNIGNLAAGTISSVLTLRRDTSASAISSLWWTRIVASAASYS